MDPSSSDLEFFDFENATEDEIREIYVILKGPGSNGCVELPWETTLKGNEDEKLSANEVVVEKTESISPVKSSKEIETVVGQALHFIPPQNPLSPPVAQLPPPAVEAFVTLPTTVGPYPNAPYFVSRTIPYLRAYPPMGVPFFACPIPGTGDTNPYGQFLPVVPATVAQEKFVNQIDIESNQKNRGSVERQPNRRSKKKLSSTEYSDSFQSDSADDYREPVLINEQAPASPVSSSISSDRPTSVPLVPLPVPPSTFAVAGGTLPLHGYPPGLHTLPYTQMSGPQTPSATMYYVPVLHHPYGSYIPSPPSGPMVLPVNLRPEAEVNEHVFNKCSKAVDSSVEDVCNEEGPLVSPASLPEQAGDDLNVQSNCKDASLEQFGENAAAQKSSVDPAAKNTNVEKGEVTDCNSSEPCIKSVSSSPDSLSTATGDCYKHQPSPPQEVKESAPDPSRCWADLFKKPCSEVNGLDRKLPAKHRLENRSTLKKDITNGKMYSVPTSDSIH